MKNWLVLLTLVMFPWLTRAQLPQSGTNPVKINAIKRDPACDNSSCQRHAIVFVHGLWGSKDTWRWSESHPSWPELVVQDSNFANFDVYVVEYPTSPGFWGPGNKVRFTEVAKGLNKVLSQDIWWKYKAVHLIGHSMGGNAILTSLIFLKLTDPNAHQLLTKCENIVLLGTPVEGSDLVHLGTLVSNDQKLMALEPVVKNELPVLIELSLDSIDEKRQMLGLSSLRISAGYETVPYLGKIIVTKESATKVASQDRPGHGDSDLIRGFQRNHLNLVKPRSTNDCVYKWVSEQIRQAEGEPAHLDCTPAEERGEE